MEPSTCPASNEPIITVVLPVRGSIWARFRHIGERLFGERLDLGMVREVEASLPERRSISPWFRNGGEVFR
jgi:hypothetical protein